MDTMIGTDYSFWMAVCSPQLKRIINTNCRKHMVVPPDDGPRHARNIYRMTKYMKNNFHTRTVHLDIIKVYLFTN